MLRNSGVWAKPPWAPPSIKPSTLVRHHVTQVHFYRCCTVQIGLLVRSSTERKSVTRVALACLMKQGRTSQHTDMTGIKGLLFFYGWACVTCSLLYPACVNLFLLACMVLDKTLNLIGWNCKRNHSKTVLWITDYYQTQSLILKLAPQKFLRKRLLILSVDSRIWVRWKIWLREVL